MFYIDPSLKLSPEQEAMFAENINLIHNAIQTYTSRGDMADNAVDYDDLFQIGSMALCKAIKTYSNTKFAFSTYATTIIRNQLYSCISRKRSDAAFVAAKIIDDPDGVSIVDGNLDFEKNACDDVMHQEHVKILLELAKEFEQKNKNTIAIGIKAMLLESQGFARKEIADMFNTSVQALTVYIQRSRKKLMSNQKFVKAFCT